MKLVFIFPFVNDKFGRPLKWLPLSAPTLIGYLAPRFPQVSFDQFDLEEEVKEAFLRRKLNRKYLKLLNQFPRQDIDFIGKKDLIKYEDFLADIVDYLNLDQYDHYLFSFYNRHKTGIKANLLLAQYLKKRFKDKKIIFGGIRGYGDNYFKQSFEEFDFIDSSVIGPGEFSLGQILSNLLKNKRIKKVYDHNDMRKTRIKNSLKRKFTSLRFGSLPDFKSFRSLRHFYYSYKDLEEVYQIRFEKKLRKNKNKKVIFIPYRFSQGCFWRKCAYCASNTSSFYRKNINEIIEDLLKLKEIYQTKYFIFYNNNFNFNLDFSKKLLRGFIKYKLDILWTDSFNLLLIDDELVDLLVKAGCFRMDLGTTILNPRLQKLYNNILQDNKYLQNFKKISKGGIWTHINLIANLPYQYSVKKEKEILDKYMEYIDGVSLNSYRRYPTSDLSVNFEKYNLKPVNYKIFVGRKKTGATLNFIEKNFKGGINKRKALAEKNYLELEDFFERHKSFLNRVNYFHLYLLGYLYDNLGFENKDKIKNIVANCG